MKIIALSLIVLMLHECQGQHCKELSIVVNIDASTIDTLQSTIKQLLLKAPSDNYFKGNCRIEESERFKGEFNYELFYCDQKEILIGVLFRKIDKFTTDTMTFIYNTSTQDGKSKADTVIAEKDRLIYALNMDSCFSKLNGIVSILDSGYFRNSYFDLRYGGIFRLFREDEPPYMKNEYIIIRTE